MLELSISLTWYGVMRKRLVKRWGTHKKIYPPSTPDKTAWVHFHWLNYICKCSLIQFRTWDLFVKVTTVKIGTVLHPSVARFQGQFKDCPSLKWSPLITFDDFRDPPAMSSFSKHFHGSNGSSSNAPTLTNTNFNNNSWTLSFQETERKL